MKKPRCKTIEVGLYDTYVFFFRGEFKDILASAEETLIKEDMQKLTKEYNTIKDMNVSWNGFSILLGGGASFIWVNKKTELSVTVHEIVHAVNHLLKSKYIPLTEDTDEMYAYLTQYLFKKCQSS